MPDDIIYDTLANRQKTHGEFKSTASAAQSLKEILHEHGADNLSPVQYEAIDMIASKLARIVCGNPNEPDHWLDIEGYARLARNNK